MLTSSLLNPLNYVHIGSFPVPNGKDLVIPPRTELSPVMMVRWMINHVAKDIDINEISR